MRKIKFRGWNKVANFMIYWDEFIDYEKDQMEIVGKDYRIFNDSEFVLLQYTGLKDKNGKEIYEGDIYKRYDNIFVVIFDELGFKCKRLYDSWLEKNVYNRNEISLLSKVDSDYCYEVIGNIYENAELLEVAE